MPDRPRVVIDTNVIVNVLTEGGRNDEHEWLEHSRNVLATVLEGRVEAFLSVITVAEILGAPEVRGNHLTREERYRRKAAAWKWIEGSPLTVIEADASMGLEAGRLAQNYQLKGADALILASATRVRAGRLYTWDEDLLKIADQVEGLMVCKPSVLRYQCQDVLAQGGVTVWEESGAHEP